MGNRFHIFCVKCLLSDLPEPGSLVQVGQTPRYRRLNRIQERALPMQAKYCHSTKTSPWSLHVWMCCLWQVHTSSWPDLFLPHSSVNGEKSKTGAWAKFWMHINTELYKILYILYLWIIEWNMQRADINRKYSGGLSKGRICFLVECNEKQSLR